MKNTTPKHLRTSTKKTQKQMRKRNWRRKILEFLSLVTYTTFCTQIFSKVEAYINKQQIYNSNGLYAHNSYISNNFKGAISEQERVLDCQGYDYEKDSDEIMEALLSEPFLSKRVNMLSRPAGFILPGKLDVDLLSTSELLNPNIKTRLL